MRKSTRYEIRKGARLGLDIRRVTEDAEVLRVLDVYKETAERAGFAIHSDEYYVDINRSLGDKSVLVATYVDDVPACFAWCVNSASTSFLLYGGGNDAGRKATATAPTYWRTIEIAREQGLVRYDMNGLLNDGISDFKKSFAKHTDELVGLDRRRVLALVQHLEHGPADRQEGGPQAPRQRLTQPVRPRRRPSSRPEFLRSELCQSEET